ncbi:MAG TPA: fumarylacetoacetate hydrolase family protein [Burkholderiales bacterium]|jgi:2-oxo-3-hexenedioate decarboxylase|nr:fumarylacetoacetate hydrolase family protein [Burkholderiales bacterium]
MTPEQGYAQARALHEERLRQGWRPLGRKIGFTNRTIWPLYGVYEPMWGTVYDRTVLHAKDDACRVSLDGLLQPRIEPEILFRLRTPPRSARAEELASCLDWVAHSIEIVQCRQPGWKVTLAECAADNGLHGRLIVGAPVPREDLPDLEARLPHTEARLFCASVLVDRGSGENVLGSPLAALAHLVDLLARQGAAPLAAGEIVSTGTLTDAHPVAPGETWSTEIRGLPLHGLTVHFA